MSFSLPPSGYDPVPVVRAYPSPSIPMPKSSLGDGVYSNPPVPKAMIAPTPRTVDPAPSPKIPSLTNPPKAIPEPKVQRAPFEQRKPTVEPNRQPTMETYPSKPSVPNTLKPTPMDPPPSLVPKAEQVKPKSVPKDESPMPDVLIDPFKDDASHRSKKQKLEGILLTSGRRASSSSPKNGSLNLNTARPNSQNEKPATLTPTQRQSATQPAESSLQFEAQDASAAEEPQVVSTSYLEMLPVKVARRISANEESNDSPQVPRIRVPQRR